MFGEAKGTLPRLIVHQQQIVDLLQGPGRTALALRASSFHAPHEGPAPPVRRGIANGAEHWRVSRRMKSAGANLKSRFEREPGRVPQPRFLVFETRTLLILAYAGPQPP